MHVIAIWNGKTSIRNFHSLRKKKQLRALTAWRFGEAKKLEFGKTIAHCPNPKRLKHFAATAASARKYMTVEASCMIY